MYKKIKTKGPVHITLLGASQWFVVRILCNKPRGKVIRNYFSWSRRYSRWECITLSLFWAEEDQFSETYHAVVGRFVAQGLCGLSAAIRGLPHFLLWASIVFDGCLTLEAMCWKSCRCWLLYYFIKPYPPRGWIAVEGYVLSCLANLAYCLQWRKLILIKTQTWLQ